MKRPLSVLGQDWTSLHFLKNVGKVIVGNQYMGYVRPEQKFQIEEEPKYHRT